MRLCLLLLLTSLLAACGSGSDTPFEPTTSVLERVEDRTYRVDSDGLTGKELFVGYYDNKSHRVLYGFDLGALPAGAAIVKAELRLRHTFDVGLPDLEFGVPLLASVDLDQPISDLDLVTSEPLGGPEEMTLPDDGEVTHDVTAWVAADHAAARPMAGFRIQLPVFKAPDSDAAFGFDDPSDADYTGPATLTIVWTLP